MTALVGFFSRDDRTALSRAALGMMICLVTCVLTGLLAGCGSLSITNASPKIDYFVLQDLGLPAPSTAGALPRSNRVLLIAGSTSQALFDSERMVFTKDGISRSYYQFANWSERPAQSLAILAEARLSRVDSFRAVTQSTSGVKADLLLTLRLNELTHDDSVSPGLMRLEVTADLLDWRARELIARRVFTRSVAVASRDSIGGAQAANRAITTMLDDLLPWVESNAATLK
jgi:cholesterol transport system auxiliary component